MKRLTREEQALCLSVYAFSETMFKTSMGKTGTSFSGDKGLKLLSVGEVKVKQKATASTQHLPFPHKLKLRMAQSQTPREAQMIHAPSLAEPGISQQFGNQMPCWLPRSGRETDSFQSQHLRRRLLMNLKFFNSICFISHQRITTGLVS